MEDCGRAWPQKDELGAAGGSGSPSPSPSMNHGCCAAQRRGARCGAAGATNPAAGPPRPASRQAPRLPATHVQPAGQRVGERVEHHDALPGHVLRVAAARQAGRGAREGMRAVARGRPARRGAGPVSTPSCVLRGTRSKGGRGSGCLVTKRWKTRQHTCSCCADRSAAPCRPGPRGCSRPAPRSAAAPAPRRPPRC